MTRVRIASWNLNGRTEQAAERLGKLLARYEKRDLALLQEVSRKGLPRFTKAAGLEWSVDVRDHFEDLLKVRGRAGTWDLDSKRVQPGKCVAVAGCGDRLTSPIVFPDMPAPEKVMAGWVRIGGQRTTVVSYHSPNGADYKERKAEQAVRLADWLRKISGPVILAGDFNTPGLDPPEWERVEVGWRTEKKGLNGERGEDYLVGVRKQHALEDALRTHLRNYPDEMAAIAAERPGGPLAVSYRPKGRDPKSLRYDSIWLSPHFDVSDVKYVYEEAIAAGSDHGLVLVEAKLRSNKGTKR